MQVQYRPTRAEIDLEHLRSNYESFRSVLPQQMKLMVCVKANAYGHGAVEIARELEQLGSDYLSVAFLDEALELRRAGITLPVLVLGYTSPEAVQTAWENDITLTLFTPEVLQAVRMLDRKGSARRLKLHIKMDSGMGRLGLLLDEGTMAFIEKVWNIEAAELEGIYTHFARADEKDKSYTLEQYRKFQCVVSALNERGYSIPIMHTGNSATALDMPELSFDMIRIGVAMYGLYPSDEVNHKAVKLLPLLTLKTEMSYVKVLPPRSGISYGTRYTTVSRELIGTIPIGYGDGYSRMMSGKAEVLVRGQRIPVVGTICMDQCMISLQSFARESVEIHAGEEVVLIGQQSGEHISVNELASWLGTINYEVVCMIANRVPRLYMRASQLISLRNPLL